MATQTYTYRDAGFSSFFTRSIGGMNQQSNLSAMAASISQNFRDINFDQQQITGTMGDTLTIGSSRSSIVLDGNRTRISIFDKQDEVVAIGDLTENG